MRYCPVCTIQTPLMSYEVNGVRGERCIPCKKMWILETTFFRALDQSEVTIRELGKSKIQCPDCRGLFYQYEVQKHDDPFLMEKCNQCHSVWMPVGAVNAYLELEPANPNLLTETVTIGENPGISHWINQITQIPEIEESHHVKKRVKIVKNSNLSLIIFIFTLLAMNVSLEKFGFLTSDPWRWAGLTWITHAFLHADVFHFLGNMFVYFVFSYRIEDRIGSEGFFTLYILGAVFSAGFQLLFGSHQSLLVGASGAIFGLITYYALTFPTTKVVDREFVVRAWSWTASRRSVYVYMIILVAGNFIYLNEINSGIAYLGHLGGALAGFLYFLFGKKPEYQKALPKG